MKNKFSEHDIDLAREVSALNESVKNLDSVVRDGFSAIAEARKELWEVIKSHSASIKMNHGRINWIIGVGSGIVTVFSVLKVIGSL